LSLFCTKENHQKRRGPKKEIIFTRTQVLLIK
jgi:hypothetical protein